MPDISQQTTLGNVLALDIQERRKQALEGKISRYARTVSILSDISECERQMEYQITNWQDKPLHDTDLQARFNAGNDQERLLIQELLSMGYEFKAGQEVVEIKNRAGEVIGRGKIDGKIRYHGVDFATEFKSMNDNVFKQVNTIDDFRKKPYLRKYLRQLQSYCYGNNCEEGLLICTNCLGAIKIFVVTLDYGEAEAILQRLERVHDHLKAKTLSERIEYSDEECGRCPFAMVCLPDIVRAESEVVTDPEWLEKVQEHERLKPLSRKYDDLHDEIKRRFEKVKKAIAGDYVIFGRQQTKPEHTVKESTFWVSTIKPLADVGIKK